MLSDTHPEAERVQIELIRQMTGAQRVAQMRSQTALAVKLSRQAIARANPHLNQHEVDMLWIEYTYGKDLADRVREDWKTRRQCSSATP
jgi:hypothetical protein